jgi:hypothetical protein
MGISLATTAKPCRENLAPLVKSAELRDDAIKSLAVDRYLFFSFFLSSTFLLNQFRFAFCLKR